MTYPILFPTFVLVQVERVASKSMVVLLLLGRLVVKVAEVLQLNSPTGSPMYAAHQVGELCELVASPALAALFAPAAALLLQVP